MSLRGKLTLWYTLMMVVIAALVLFVMLQAAQTMEASAAEKTLETVVERNGLELWIGPEGMEKFDFRSYEKGVYLLLYNTDGTLLEGTLPVELPETAFSSGGSGRIETTEGAFYYYDYYVRASAWSAASGEMGACGEPGADGIWVRGVTPVGSGTDTMGVAFIVMPILVILSALGGWLMAGRALAPVRKITTSVREISGGEDLSRRVALGPGRDELHQLADTFDGMLDRLEQSFLAERQFTSDASHELRTPTAVILAACDTAQKTAQTTEDYAQSIGIIQRQARKMSALIAALLTYTRREQGTERLERELVDISELVDAVCQEQRQVHPGTVTLETHLERPVMAMADMNLMTSLVQNLVSNAYKYNRVDGHIWVELTQKSGKLYLSVKDDGIGIAPEKQQLVWNRFYQADSARTNGDGSLGLGLSMAQQIARLHGGAITLESQVGQGSCFTFVIDIGE